MSKETFRESGPGYLEYGGQKLGERVWGDTLLCNRLEIREARAEFEIYWVTFRREFPLRFSESWSEIKREKDDRTFNNKVDALKYVKSSEHDYLQCEQEDVADRIEQQREQDGADRETPSSKVLRLVDLSRAAQEWERAQQTPEQGMER